MKRTKTALKLTALAFLGLFATYIGAAAVFLNTPLFGLALGLDPGLDIRFNLALSFFPGRATIWKARVLGQDANVSWEIGLDRVDARFSLSELFERKFIFEDVKARQASFHLVMKPPKEQAANRAADRLKLFDELKLPAALRARPDALKTPLALARKSEFLERKKASRWQLDFRKITIEELDQVDVASLSFRGRSHVEGAFSLWPGVQASIGPARLEITDARSTFAGQELARGLHGAAGAFFHPWIIDHIEGNDVFGQTDADILFEGDLRMAGALSAYLKPLGLKVTGDSAPARIEAHVSRGHILAGSRIEAARQPLTLSKDALSLRGQAKLEFTVRPEARPSESDAGLVLLRLAFSDFDIRSREALLLRGRKLELLAASSDLYIPHPTDGLLLEANLADSRLPDLRAWTQFFKSRLPELSITGGSGRLSGRFEVSTDAVNQPPERLSQPSPGTREAAGLRLVLEDLSARYGPYELATGLTAEGELKHADLKNEKAELTGSTLTLTGLKMSKAGKMVFEQPKNWLSLAVDQTWLDGHASSFLEGSSRVTVDPLGPLLMLYEVKHELPGLLTSWFEHSTFTGRATFLVDPKAIVFPVLEGRAGGARFNGTLSLLDVPAQGSFAIEFGLLRLGVRIADSETHLKLFPSRDWLQAEPVSGSDSDRRDRAGRAAGP